MNCILVPLRRLRRSSFVAFPSLLLALVGLISAANCAPAFATAAPLSQEAKPLFTPGQILVQFRATTRASDRARIAREESADPIADVTPDGLVKVRLGASDTIERATARFAQRPEVAYAVPIARAQAFFIPNDSLIQTFDLAWNLRSVHAYDAWDIQTGDPRIVVAMLDSGVAYEDHDVPDYERAHLWPGTTQYKQSPDLPGPFVPGWDFINDDAFADDDNGHGTTTATIVAGAPNNVAGSAGIAFGVTLMPIKVIDWRRDSDISFIAAGLRFAADHGADIVNMSLGLPPLDTFRNIGMTESQIRQMLQPLRDAVNYAQGRGVILVASSGNFDAGEVSLPAGYPGVIAVGATDPDGRRTSYSSFGRNLDLMAPGGDFTDLNNDHVQDAVFVLSIKPNRSEGSLAKPDSFGCFPFFGTSASAPHVAGAVALLMSKGYKAQGAIERTLSETAVRPAGPSPFIGLEYGAGLIQLDAALRLPAPGGGQAAATAAGALSARLLSRNPARGEASLAFRTERPGRVSIRVFDVRGVLVRTIDDRDRPAGEQQARWDGRDDSGARVATGVYLLRIETAEGAATRKVAFLR